MLPTPEIIKSIAIEYGYEERRDEASNTLFFRDASSSSTHPTLINVFYTTGGIMTKLDHPTGGYNQLWRSDAYDSASSLAVIFANPRAHTGRGYRVAGGAVRGCARCGLQRKRGEFSKNQWRKGSGQSKCATCVSDQQQQQQQRVVVDGDDQSTETNWQCLVHSITCDAEGCSNGSPSIRCQNCCVVYYCSEACKRRHQWIHSQECMNLEQFRYQFQQTNHDPNLNSGLCNADPGTLFQMRGYAMATQLSGERTVEALLLQAEAIHQFDGHWEQAFGIYQQIFMMSEGMDHTEIATPSQWRQVWMGISRCFYELGMYDKAVNAGQAALEMNRHFPQAHRYVALAQKAMGNHALAIKTVKAAVLYEAPWCDETIQFNKDLLRDIRA